MAETEKPTPWVGSPRAPRRWQTEALTAIGAALRQGKRPIVRAATGSGKSGLISELVHLMRTPGEVVIIVAPRQSLVEQLSGVEGRADLRPGSVAWRCGADSVGVFFGRRKVGLDRDVIVTCTPSLPLLAQVLAGRRCRLLVVDEAHRSETPTVLGAVESLSPRYIVGLSATPWRSEPGETLSIFTEEVYTYGLGESLRDGVLVPWRTETIRPEWGEVRQDEACLRLIREYAEGPGIVSASSIEDAQEYASYLTTHGIPAVEVHSNLARSEQARRISALLAGEVRCLVHVALLQEGTDIPELRWICLRRPTATAIRFVQEIGRVLRTHPGKTHAIVLDPYDLEGAIGITHDSRIGEALDEKIDSESQHEQQPERSDQVCEDCGEDFWGFRAPEPNPTLCPRCKIPPAVAVSGITQWARRTVLALVCAGYASQPLSGGLWRSALPSEKQMSALGRLLPVHARHIVTLRLSRGEVSDLIGAFGALRRLPASAVVPDLPPFPADEILALEARR